jgi:GrpB-like predicted nucleotidyltransferase (UPF0157 family)
MPYEPQNTSSGPEMTEVDEAIELSEYQATWPRVFAEEQGRICQVLGIPGEDLEHTGSTAVPGLVAKPIVDLMLGVGQFPPEGEFLKRIELLGWEALGEAGVPGRLYFRMRGARQANLHVVLKSGAHWVNNLAIRDYLRKNPNARERYANAKRRAVDHGARTLLRYSAEKAEFVQTLLKEALATQR